MGSRAYLVDFMELSGAKAITEVTGDLETVQGVTNLRGYHWLGREAVCCT